MAEKKIDSSFLDKAIIFATNAHKNTERRGKGFPYIVHPLEALSIAASITNDQEILAAAVLHDVVEDTEYTAEDIEREFGKRVAELVCLESDNMDIGYHENITWKERKIQGLKRIKYSSRDEQIVALGDKLSNMRAIHDDWLKMGDRIWEKFHENDPSIHAWRYYQLSNCFDKLEGTYALEEFKYRVREVFGGCLHDFKIEKNENILKIYGKINGDCANIIEEEMNKIDGDPYLDFEEVAGVDYAAVRVFYRLATEGKRYFIRNANKNIVNVFYKSGTSSFICITEKPVPIDMNDYEVSGDGYTAISYFHKNGDTMMKLYAPFMPQQVIEREKIVATRTLTLGVNTPLCTGLVTANGQIGICFERIKGKRSVARAISEEPERIEEFMHAYTSAVKKLHATKCDKALFENVGNSFFRELDVAKDHFTEEEFEKIKQFIIENEKGDTCIHGDLHIGNVLLTEGGDTLFIDMADFCYGNPLFDVAILYVMSHVISDENMVRLYHVDRPTMVHAWELFIKEYFGANTKEEIEKIDNLVKPYAGIRILQFANRSKWRDGSICEAIKGLIFGNKEEQK